MEIISHLNLLKRHLVVLVLIVVVSTAMGTFIGLNKKAKGVVSTSFISIGALDNEKDSIVDVVEASDKFAETVQGWFRNPKVLSLINEKIKNVCGDCNDVSISVAKQEKQNLV